MLQFITESFVRVLFHMNCIVIFDFMWRIRDILYVQKETEKREKIKGPMKD